MERENWIVWGWLMVEEEEHDFRDHAYGFIIGTVCAALSILRCKIKNLCLSMMS